MSLDTMWLFLYSVLREPLIGAAALAIVFGMMSVLLSAFNRVGKEDEQKGGIN